MNRSPMCLTKEKKKKRNIKEKEKEGKLQHFALKPKHGLRGLWQKPLKSGALSQLVGSHQLSVRYTSGWAEFSEL